MVPYSEWRSWLCNCSRVLELFQVLRSFEHRVIERLVPVLTVHRTIATPVIYGSRPQTTDR